MKILITGHKGFIGKHLTKKLDQLSIEWIGFDIKDGYDIRDKESLKIFFDENKFTHIIHLAAVAGVRRSLSEPEPYITTNIVGTYNLLEFIKDEHFIFFSSSSVYGNQPSPNSEYEEMLPESLYGSTKMMGEILTEELSKIHTIIRPFTVYGEDGREDQLIYKWINQIKKGEPITVYGDGKTKRGYTYVGDLINGVLSIITLKKEGIYNLGGSEITSLKEVVDIFDYKNIEYKDLPTGDIPENWADISKANIDLGYSPNTPFKEKVKEIIKIELQK